MTGFPADLTMALTGVTKHQLTNWRRTGLLIPEVSTERPPLYSFRDLVALRTVAKLRATVSLQRVRKAFGNLAEFDLTEHLSEYRFAVHGKTIVVWTDDGFMDLVQEPGQYELYSLDTIYRPFVNMRGDQVVDFERPRPHLEVNARKLGGWPTIEGSRVPFDTVADAMTGDTAIRAEDLRRFYPGVTPVAAHDALDFAVDVAGRRSA